MTYGNSISYPATIAMNNSLNYQKNIVHMLWESIKKSKNILNISINIAKIDNELVITVIDKKKLLRFKNSDSKKLVETIKAYFN